MAGFATGGDHPEQVYITLLLPPPEAAEPLARAALDRALALRLLAARYSANAYPFSLDYQNCNQWVMEVLASAFAPPAVAQPTRAQAQTWLREAGYAPEPVHVDSRVVMWVGRVMPLLHFDDHPPEAIARREVQTSLPDGIEAFVLARWPATQRVELCLGPQGAVMREGLSMLREGCVPAPDDRVVEMN
jgi:hypothetical protein